MVSRHQLSPGNTCEVGSQVLNPLILWSDVQAPSGISASCRSFRSVVKKSPARWPGPRASQKWPSKHRRAAAVPGTAWIDFSEVLVPPESASPAGAGPFKYHLPWCHGVCFLGRSSKRVFVGRLAVRSGSWMSMSSEGAVHNTGSNNKVFGSVSLFVYCKNRQDAQEPGTTPSSKRVDLEKECFCCGFL